MCRLGSKFRSVGRAGLVAACSLACLSGCRTGPKALSVSAPFVHVVLFKQKPGAPPTAVQDLLAECRSDLAVIPVVKSVWAGYPAPTKNASRPFVDDDYDVGLLIVVPDQRALEDYFTDPRHVRFAEKHNQNFDVRVFDFEPRPSTPAGP